MRQKPCRITFRVSERQREVLAAEAERLGITVSELVLRMAAAWLEAQRREEPVAAVTYGEWLLVYHDLAGIEEALLECARQLAATRRVASALADRGALTERQHAVMVEAVRSCHEDVAGARSRVSGCVELLEGMRDAWVATDVSGLPAGSALARGRQP